MNPTLLSTLRKVAESDRQDADHFNREHLHALKARGCIYYDGYGYVKPTKVGRRNLTLRSAPGRKSQVLVPVTAPDAVLMRFGLTSEQWKALIMEVAC